MDKFITQQTEVAPYSAEEVAIDGRTYIVVPTVMMLEGVHAGSGGPLLHLEENLSIAVNSWNGIPIMVRHPQDRQGNFISANASPDMIAQHVGYIFNARMEDGKLKADAYVDVTKIEAVSPTALEYIRQNRPMDVSVGVFNSVLEEEGDWNGEHYIGVASNYRPDHLALLPGEQGACNWADGCGIRVNSKNNNQMETYAVEKKLNKSGQAVVPVVNATSLQTVLNAIYEHVNAMDNDLRINFVEDVFEDHFVYRVRNRNTNSNTLYRQYYSYSEEGALQLNGEAAEVRKNVTYETLQSMQRTKFNINSKTNVMDEKIKQRVDELINANGRFVECDRQWLSALSLENLAKLEATGATKTVEKTVEVPAQLDVNTAIDFLKKNAPEKDSVLSLLSAEDKQAYEAGVAAYEKQRTDAIATVVANTKQFEEAELKAMDFNLLTKLAKSFEKEDAADYSGQAAGGALNTNAAGEDNFLPPTSAYASIKK